MSISSSAVLVSLNVSCWPASVKDRKVTEQVITSANADADAGKFMKDLFAGTSVRKNIELKAAQIRARHQKLTLPWADKGDRLLTTAMFMEYKTWLNQSEAEYTQLCDTFYDSYPQLLAEAPVRLKSLYDPEDYPSIEEMRNKFGFRLVFSPVPDAGDFRLDLPKQELDAMRMQYESHANERVEAAMKDQWGKLHDMVARMSEKLIEPEGDDKRRWHDTFITNAQEMCAMLTHLNITRDPELEAARRELERAIAGVEIDHIKDDSAVREDVKIKLDAILKQYEW